MNLPRILMIDDELGSDTNSAAELRDELKEKLGLVDLGTKGSKSNKIAEIIFCSGQLRTNGKINNDYDLIHNTVSDTLRSKKEWALILLDVQFDSGKVGNDDIRAGLPGDDSFGENVRPRLLKDFPSLPVVLLTGKRHDELINSKVNYLSKNGLTQQGLRECLLRHGCLTLEQRRQLLELGNDIFACSPASLEVFQAAMIHATSGIPVLILGETGVGKEVLSDYIRRQSRRNGPFVALNIAAVPDALLESELFGHEKGSFTGAYKERMGKFELANGGTLFLDEIGDMPATAQVKVLRALEERQIERVGGNKPIRVDFSLITATSRDLPSLIGTGQFREDLYYRINQLILKIPPLRERKEEIIPFFNFLLEKAQTRIGKTGISLSLEAADTLVTYPFKGNIRELGSLARRVANGAGNFQVISAEDIEASMAFKPSSDTGATFKQNAATPNDVGFNLDEALAMFDRIVIKKDDPMLRGAKKRLEAVFQVLLQRLAGAALERYRDPDDHSLKREPAMRLLTGESKIKIKGKEPQRVVNKILGRLVENPVTDDDLEYLVNKWQAGKHN